MEQSPPSNAHEDIRVRHRREQRDLQAKVTQKKKSASKRTRKGVNDECATLEKELAERHAIELEALNGSDHLTKDGPNASKTDVREEQIAEGVGDDNLLDAIVNEASGLEEATKHLQIERLDHTEAPITDGTSLPLPKVNRQKQRLARREAEKNAVIAQAKEEAANMPDAKQVERKSMLEEFAKRGLKEQVVAANGHCMYLAFADQLHELDVDPAAYDGSNEEQTSSRSGGQHYKHVREAAASYISAHPDDYAPFLEEPLDGYVSKIRDTAEWGGHLELMALAKTYNIDVNVLQANGQVEKMESGKARDNKTAWLAYYRHGFGLGEHYNSLRNKVELKPSG
ncbi:MAG: hypothetical protein M1828_003143 [Chrysothrix sp. TS-e1954]|nr:MAG: hypothetical protein M1828_003143 [Chrysothrix sp. TS-e1954]